MKINHRFIYVAIFMTLVTGILICGLWYAISNGCTYIPLVGMFCD